MVNFKENAVEELLQRNLISQKQNEEIKTYRDLNIFSLHNELRFLIYLSVILFTGGVGILIYKNIDTIGHTIILGLILVLTAICFYLSYKKSKGFSYNEVLFDNPLYDYLVLLSTILSCTFVGYLQFQYHTFGNSFGIASLVGSTIAFIAAYYFDNKSALSIAITGLATYVGISITPQTLVENDVYSSPTLAYSGLALGAGLVFWTIYCTKTNLKKHFNLVFLTFALHLCSICLIAGLLIKFGYQEISYWYFFIPLLVCSVYYFNKVSYEISAVSIFLFNVIYAYVGFNIILGIFFSYVDYWNDVWVLLLFLFPFYLIISIVLFIKGIKKFNKTNHDSI